ncbi:MAG TPA: AAA family ATPase, partial [Noviherbaspirillum sp.]|nr:AAA family ATPase [Noviherbaspirillum sp.]
MYTRHFHLQQPPFSIAPDPRYLFMSERHREALAHLLYGIDGGGGIVLLSGEIGTGKTTLCRCLLEQVPANCNIAYVFNPKLSATELLEAICAEFRVTLAPNERRTGTRAWTNALNRFLLEQHALGRNNVLVIDEAQNLSADVLEQLRLLTNLETNQRKLLQIILIGQPELRTMLAQPRLEQLAQRVIAHYHLGPLNEQETASYVQHRMTTAGLHGPSPFQPGVMRHVHRLSGGVPRRINLLCDRALLGAYAEGVTTVSRRIVEHAASELFIHASRPSPPSRRAPMFAFGAAAGILLAAGAAWLLMPELAARMPRGAPGVAVAAPQPAAEPAAAVEEKQAVAQESAAVTPPFAGIRNETQALRELAALWGWQDEGGDPCAGNTQGLRCYRSSGGLAEL